MHRGKVFCDSEPGRGTVFTMLLPRQPQPAGEPAVTEKPVAADKTTVLLEELMENTEVPEPVKAEAPVSHGLVAEELLTARKSVLIVDDNEEMRGYLQRLFTPAYLVYAAASGEEGFAAAGLHKPDIIISDVFMHEMSGVDMCRRIKETEALAHIPVILLTATTSEELKLQGIEGGADDYLNKPFDSDILLARVETILKNQHQLRRYYLDSISLREHSHKVPAEYQHFMSKCIEIIEENMENKEFTMKMFAREMGMSHSNLYTKVKAISGQSVTAFMRSVRIRRAAVLMLTENLSVKEAAFRVGIIDAKYFREQFVRIFEMTPSDYIKKYRHSFNRDLNTVPKDE
jgi:DNA-binding response OmpR family regulator